MKTKNVFLGIDTSNYTTSIALCDQDGRLLVDKRQILEVKNGERGLRQSEALFQHTNNLPKCLSEIDFSQYKIKNIGVSVSPRPIADSYMPVFRVGFGVAKALASVLNVPLNLFSHQEGHIRAAMYGCGLNSNKINFPFLATHFSGGTSEIILVDKKDSGFSCSIIGQTLDLNAGQLVDRIGVASGLSFPAGKAMETLAMSYPHSSFRISSRVEGADFHFSGQENQAKKLLIAGYDPGEIAYALFKSIAKTLERSIRYSVEKTQVKTIVFSGGVMANVIIKHTLKHRFRGSGIKLFFSDPCYATDNAVGCALLAQEATWEN